MAESALADRPAEGSEVCREAGNPAARAEPRPRATHRCHLRAASPGAPAPRATGRRAGLAPTAGSVGMARAGASPEERESANTMAGSSPEETAWATATASRGAAERATDTGVPNPEAEETDTASREESGQSGGLEEARDRERA